MAEYALILGGIAVVVIAGILILGPRSATSSIDGQLRHRPSRAPSQRSTLGAVDRAAGCCDRRPRLVVRTRLADDRTARHRPTRLRHGPRAVRSHV